MMNPATGPKGVLFFDFDGVILDSVHVKADAFEKLFAEYGPDVARKVREHHLTHSGMSRYDKFRHHYEVLLGRTFTERDNRFLDREFSRLVSEGLEQAQFIPGVLDLLQWAARTGFPAYVVSAAPRSELLDICEKRGIRDLFDEVYGLPRKKTEAIAHVLRKRGAAPKRCVLFGDSLSDLQAALESGLHFVGINALNPKYFLEHGVPCLKDFCELDRDALPARQEKEY